jgi:hypothetical protein
LKKRDLTLPSNLTGKYYFAAVTLLIFSHIVYFPFGQTIFLLLSAVLFVLSSVNYARIFFIVGRGGKIPTFNDKSLYKYLRIGATLLIVLYGFYRLYYEVVMQFTKP